MEKQKNQAPDSAITYHNKDVISKLFGEKLKNKSFEANETGQSFSIKRWFTCIG